MEEHRSVGRWPPTNPPMLFNEAPPTCLSDSPHDVAVTHDLLQHYLGCIEFNQREQFLDIDHYFWGQRVALEFEKLKSQSKDAQTGLSDHDMRLRAREEVKRAMLELAISVEDQHKRTDVLRATLRNERPQDSKAKSNLVANVDRSRRNWRASLPYREGIERVRTWRARMGRHIDPAGPTEDIDDAPQFGQQAIRSFIRLNQEEKEESDRRYDKEYDLEQDVHAHLVQYTLRDGESQRLQDGTRAFTSQSMSSFKVSPLNDNRYKGRFPHQHVSLSSLLGSTGAQSILSKELCDTMDPTRLKYIHLPFNNMEVRISQKDSF